MSQRDREHQNKHADKSFFERCILGGKPQKIKKKIVRISHTQESKKEVLSVSETKPAVKKLSIVSEDAHSPIAEVPKIVPAPFDSDALFVPIGSHVRQGSVVIETPESPVLMAYEDSKNAGKVTYFNFGNGIAVNTLHGLEIYIKSLSEEDFKDQFLVQREKVSDWVNAELKESKLAKLLLLADSKDEALLYMSKNIDSSSTNIRKPY